MSNCSPYGLEYYQSLEEEVFDCTRSCSGLFADILFVNDTHNFVQQEKEDGMLQQLLTEYKQYKANFVENIEYDGEMSDYSKF